jgi:hypothetical protein
MTKTNPKQPNEEKEEPFVSEIMTRAATKTLEQAKEVE